MAVRIDCSARLKAKLTVIVIIVGLCFCGFLGPAVLADGIPAPRYGLPAAVDQQHFAGLLKQSPFQRTVEAGGSMILTGFSRIDGATYATLYDPESRASRVVAETANPNDPDGWKLVDVRGDEKDFESMTARLENNSGELVSVRYEEIPKKPSAPSIKPMKPGKRPISSNQEDEIRRFAKNPNGDFSSDGFGGPMPQELQKKLMSVGGSTREEILRRMVGFKNNGISGEKRQKIFTHMVNEAVKRGK